MRFSPSNCWTISDRSAVVVPLPREIRLERASSIIAGIRRSLGVIESIIDDRIVDPTGDVARYVAYLLLVVQSSNGTNSPTPLVASRAGCELRVWYQSFRGLHYTGGVRRLRRLSGHSLLEVLRETLLHISRLD